MTKKIWRSALPVALAAAIGISAAPAQAAASAQARLATAATKAPNKKVTAIVQFKPSVGEQRAAKLVRAHGGKITSRVPFIHGLAVKLPAKQAKALGKERGVVNV